MVTCFLENLHPNHFPASSSSNLQALLLLHLGGLNSYLLLLGLSHNLMGEVFLSPIEFSCMTIIIEK